MHVTPTLEKRASSTASSSSSSSNPCSGKHSSDAACQKPSSSNGLEIGLGVGIPVFVILCVLGLFMFKNYRKEKKEAMDHDPDFDENGDATALPDFPAFSKEDPFRNRGSVNMIAANGGYPLMQMANKSTNELGSVVSPVGTDENHVDGFVLPYQNQIGSKASLHEFARTSTDMRLYHQRRGSEYSNFTALAPSAKVSPVKGNGRDHTRSDYAHLPNKSTTSLGHDGFYDAKNSDNSYDSSKSSADFAVEYENESKMAINATLPSSRKSRALSSHLRNEGSDLESVIDSDDAGENSDRSMDRSNTQTSPSVDLSSPFEDKHAPTRMELPVQDRGDAPETSYRQKPLALAAEPAREPRMSQFDMLQNVSDDENEADVAHRNMTEEQEEELARMKSVYKVYFDRSNSVASQKEHKREFQADNSQPLPAIDVDHLKINSELQGDTAYDRRKTATSSIYEEGLAGDVADGKVIHPYQQFNVSGQPQGRPPPPAPREPVFQEPPRSPDDLLPLKSLPHASDIRNSTLETYTLYQPRKVSSPSLRHQQNQFDESGSPYMASQTSFATSGSPRLPHGGEIPPVIRDNSTTLHSSPSASQLSRTSVVMLNPVTEITSQRKFKPAGSLPSGLSPNVGYGNNELSTGDDLIPGNRKSAVRRMMNSNF